MNAPNSSRERILGRIREGLQAPAPALEAGDSTTRIFDPVENPLERFLQEAKTNLMECELTANPAGSAQLLTRILESLPAGEIFVQDDPRLRQLVNGVGTSRAVRWSSAGGPAETSQATVTLAEALIAQTGSIFVTARCGGRGASVVAPCHIVYASTAQLVPDLATALGAATKQALLEKSSYACMISGSSRTADIEKILVQGAHGPMRLVVILENIK